MSTLRTKVIAGVATLMMVGSCAALVGCGGGEQGAASGQPTAAAGAYKDGVYEGVGTGGKMGDIAVKVTVSGGKITAVEIGDNAETAERLNKAKEAIIPAVIEKQSADVEGVSGATMSSNALKDGIAKALEQAKK